MSESEEQKKEEKKKEIKVGDSLTLTDTVTVIKIREEAAKELDKVPQSVRQDILDEAVELSKGTLHPYDVSLEEVREAKRRKGASS